MKRKIEIEVDIPEEMDEEFIQLYMQLPPSSRPIVKTFIEGGLFGMELESKK